MSRAIWQDPHCAAAAFSCDNHKQQLPWVRMLALPQIGTPSGQHYQHITPFLAAASRQVLQANSGLARIVQVSAGNG